MQHSMLSDENVRYDTILLGTFTKFVARPFPRVIYSLKLYSR